MFRNTFIACIIASIAPLQKALDLQTDSKTLSLTTDQTADLSDSEYQINLMDQQTQEDKPRNHMIPIDTLNAQQLSQTEAAVELGRFAWNKEYVIMHKKSGLVIDIRHSSRNKGAKAWLYSFNGSSCQKFRFRNDFRIQAVHSGKYLTRSNRYIVQDNKNNRGNQLWHWDANTKNIRTKHVQTDQGFFLNNVKKAEYVRYQPLGNRQQDWYLLDTAFIQEPTYRQHTEISFKIKNHVNPGYLTIQNCGSKDKTRIILSEQYEGAENQLFRFDHQGRIWNPKSGKFLTVEHSINNKLIYLYKESDKQYQKFSWTKKYAITLQPQQRNKLPLAFENSVDSPTSLLKLKYRNDFDYSKQKFYLTAEPVANDEEVGMPPVVEYYIRNRKTGHYLDCMRGNTSKNTPIFLWPWNGNNNMKFAFDKKGRIKSKSSDKFLTMKGGQVDLYRQIVLDQEMTSGSGRDSQIWFVTKQGAIKNRKDERFAFGFESSDVRSESMVISQFRAKLKDQVWDFFPVKEFDDCMGKPGSGKEKCERDVDAFVWCKSTFKKKPDEDEWRDCLYEYACYKEKTWGGCADDRSEHGNGRCTLECISYEGEWRNATARCYYDVAMEMRNSGQRSQIMSGSNSDQKQFIHFADLGVEIDSTAQSEAGISRSYRTFLSTFLRTVGWY